MSKASRRHKTIAARFSVEKRSGRPSGLYLSRAKTAELLKSGQPATVNTRFMFTGSWLAPAVSFHIANNARVSGDELRELGIWGNEGREILTADRAEKYGVQFDDDLLFSTVGYTHHWQNLTDYQIADRDIPLVRAYAVASKEYNPVMEVGTRGRYFMGYLATIELLRHKDYPPFMMVLPEVLMPESKRNMQITALAAIDLFIPLYYRPIIHDVGYDEQLLPYMSFAPYILPVSRSYLTMHDKNEF